MQINGNLLFIDYDMFAVTINESTNKQVNK
jgi:hypothetical protein